MVESKITRVGFLLYDRNENKVLIHKRDDKEGVCSRGMWDYFGGSLEPTDLGSAEYALSRELYEELGVSVGHENVFLLNSGNENEKIFYIFFLKHKTRELKLGEGSGFVWVSFEEALDMDEKIITSDLKKYLGQLKSIVEAPH